MTRQNTILNLASLSHAKRLVSTSSSKPFMISFLPGIAVMVLIISVHASANAALIDGLVAYYDFNQTSGTSVPLVAGSGNDGVINNPGGADWVAGQANFGNALDFNGTNEFVHIAGGFTNTISGDNTHTVSMWVYPRAIVGFGPVFLDAEDLGGLDYFLQAQSTSTVLAGSGGSYRTYPGPSLTTDTWHHLLFAKTGTGDSGDVYLDGVKLTTYTSTVSSTPAGSSDFRLGTYRSGSFYLDGLMDDVAFWDRDLSEAEILSLYNSGVDLATLTTPIPEPSTCLLLGLGMLSLVRHNRRPRRSA